MARLSNFGRGATAVGSHVVASRTQRVTTSVVSLPKTKYGQSGGKKRKRR